jgi:flagellar protein FlhE
MRVLPFIDFREFPMSKRFSAWSSGVALAMLALTQPAAAQSYSAYGSTAVAPTIYTKGSWYTVAFPVAGNPPSTAKVTYVYYRWSYGTPRPSGFQVLLCDGTGTTCFDVTSAPSGGLNFSGYGVPANTPIRLNARVAGTGTMLRVQGGSSSVTVNYSY